MLKQDFLLAVDRHPTDEHKAFGPKPALVGSRITVCGPTEADVDCWIVCLLGDLIALSQ